MRIVLFSLFAALIIFLFYPGRHATYYNFIQPSHILQELVKQQRYDERRNTDCSIFLYEQLLNNEPSMYLVNNFTLPKIGGEYEPLRCKAIFKVAIIVPYRNRQQHLQLFLNYMHKFLQKQKIHYKIIVVEQNDTLRFNRAKMINVGAYEAMKMNFSCLILHDVDLLPLSLRNIYACFKKPRHMSTNIDKFRFNLPYLTIVGGVLAIQLQHFKLINGMSNVFSGWGGEDDDLYIRLQNYNLVPYRLPPEMGTYTMLKHQKQIVNKDRWIKLKHSVERQHIDGFNSIPTNYTLDLKPLFTHIVVVFGSYLFLLKLIDKRKILEQTKARVENL